jgi:3-deoxy-D-manno-octulosonic-acid transferase
MVWIKVCLYFCDHQLQSLYLVFLYNIFIFLLKSGIQIAATWNDKAKQWLTGRKKIWQELEEKNVNNESIIWIHASSAGEFEQAKPVIEKLKLSYPSYKVLVSFFSPSGYNVAGNYSGAEYIFYLPVDTAANAQRFIKLINPRLVVFIKYDFWYHYLNTLYKMQIPLLLVSAVFRQQQSFFKWYGGFYKSMLSYFKQLFVQDKESLQLLQKNGFNNSQLSGDTRFDRVAEIVGNFKEVPLIKEFIGTNKVIVAGSTWPDDEKLLKDSLPSLPNLKLILAPHEIHSQHIKQIQNEFPNAILYSELKHASSFTNKQVLIIDNVGMLSRLYFYGTITYIGGGFTKDGIHNCLEAAVYAKPVVFGPNYKKYREANELIEIGGAFSVATFQELIKIIEKLLMEDKFYNEACSKAHSYIAEQQGATQKIMNYIQENRLLTN